MRRLFLLTPLRYLPLALVNSAFARAHFDGGNAIGTRIRSERNYDWRVIVGVLADVRTAGLAAAPEPAIYFSLNQLGSMGGTSLGIFIRSSFDSKLIGAVVDIQSLDQRLTASIPKPRLATILLSFFAGLALLLSMAGLIQSRRFESSSAR